MSEKAAGSNGHSEVDPRESTLPEQEAAESEQFGPPTEEFLLEYLRPKIEPRKLPTYENNPGLPENPGIIPGVD